MAKTAMTTPKSTLIRATLDEIDDAKAHRLWKEKCRAEIGRDKLVT